MVPKINLFHTLKLGPRSKESANFFNTVWVIGGTMIVELCLMSKKRGIDWERVITTAGSELMFVEMSNLQIS